MARSGTRTLGLLNRWPVILDEDIFRFNQIEGEGTTLPTGGGTRNLYLQYERDYIARGLNDAVLRARDFLGFYPAPEWVSETIAVNGELGWSNQLYTAQLGWIDSFGRRATSVIDEDVTVDFSDNDNDQIDDRASITVTTSVDADEIAVFFRVEDGAESAASEYWQIDNLTVTDNGNGTMTLRGHKGLFAHPENIWAKSYNNGDIENKFVGDTIDGASFVDKVDVYRVYSDPTSAVQLQCNPYYTGAAASVVNATAWVTNAEFGQFRLYTGDGQSTPSVEPESVKIWYRAGLPLVNGHMDGRIEPALVRYANTLFPQQPALSNRVLSMWSDDRKQNDQYGMSEAGLRLFAALKPIRQVLKAKVTDWYPDGDPKS